MRPAGDGSGVVAGGKAADEGSDGQDPIPKGDTADTGDGGATAVQRGTGRTKNKKTTKKDKKKAEKKVDPPPVPFLQLFRFSSKMDVFLLLVGTVSAVAAGGFFPAMVILFGDLTSAFVSNQLAVADLVAANPDYLVQLQQLHPQLANVTVNSTLPPQMMEELADLFGIGSDMVFFDEITRFSVGTCTLGVILLILSYIFVTTLNIAAERQVFRLRGLFLKSMLRQEIGWYDTHQTGDFASRMTEDLFKLQEGIGEKIGMLLYFITIFFASLVNAFVHGWQLTLVILAVMPVLMIATGIVAKVQTSLTENELKAYGKAGSVAEEVLGAIKTVTAFGGQEKEVDRYERCLLIAKKAGIRRGMVTAVGVGLMWFIIYASYALAFWYGVKLILDARTDPDCQVSEDSRPNYCYDPGVLLIVFFSVLMGAMNVGQAAPYVEAIAVARGAASSIYGVIDEVPQIDSSRSEGLKPACLEGNISFKHVFFNYPARPDMKVLKGFSLDIKKGETVALVGSSGCGKSTCIQLLQRFYDPQEGAVEVDGLDVREVNLGWLRSQVGVVGQEPVLFGTTVAENIRYGQDGVTQGEIEKAAKQANAHNFITRLPKKYDTMVGERGAQLSGGQKQRIAIARALVRDPRILLLDEATAALDMQSEKLVQEALNKARAGRTTVVVAHRLSTIRSADKIVTLSEGQNMEEGTHDELMRKEGLYHQLVTTQIGKEEGSEEAEEENREEADNTAAVSRAEGPTERDDRRVSMSSRASGDSFSYGDTLVNVSPVSIGRSASVRRSLKKKKDSDQAKKVQEEAEDDLLSAPLGRVLRLNAPEWPCILAGCLAAVLQGGSMPVYAILFGEILGVLAVASEESARQEANYYSIFFLVTGIAIGSIIFMQVYMFSVAGESLTMRLRKLTFAAMLRQEMAWFDDPRNSTGALCARLSSDTSHVQGAAGMRVGTLLQCASTLLLSLTLALFYQWKLGLVMSIFIPLVLAGMYFESKVIFSQNIIEKEAVEEASKIGVEAITNIRTVASLGKEPTFYEMYMKALAGPHKEALKKAHIRGIVFGSSQSVPFFTYAACMLYGGYLVDNEGLPYKDVFKVAEALIFGTMMVGQALALAPNYTKAKVSANRIFRLLDREARIDASRGTGIHVASCVGNIDFEHIQFFYPSRPTVAVLQDLVMRVTSGETVALVGPSGCGKSTCVQLLERFYNPSAGLLKLDGRDVQAVNVPSLRSHLGLVGQEPVLFGRTLLENIAYGDNSRTVGMDEIIQAARVANIHNFISSLQAGYDTSVGEKGTQLSGGQKQRVAIARAIVSNPTVLLLDEATSALDSESEQVVQAALDAAREGRTCITIAHRLSTVQSADRIFVLSHGRVAEEGSHQQLLARRGLYHKLYTMQAGSKQE